MSVLAFFITTLIGLVNDSPEQIALDYFASQIMGKNYDSSPIYFSGQTETEKNIAGPFARCFESDPDFSQFYYRQKKSVADKLNIESSDFPIFKKSSKTRSRALNLKIYRVVTNGDDKYVYIQVFKEKHFVHHYLFRISSNNVVDVCNVNEII